MKESENTLFCFVHIRLSYLCYGHMGFKAFTFVSLLTSKGNSLVYSKTVFSGFLNYAFSFRLNIFLICCSQLVNSSSTRVATHYCILNWLVLQVVRCFIFLDNYISCRLVMSNRWSRACSRGRCVTKTDLSPYSGAMVMSNGCSRTYFRG